MLAISNQARSKCRQIGKIIENCQSKSILSRKKTALENHLIYTKGWFQDLNLDPEEEKLSFRKVQLRH